MCSENIFCSKSDKEHAAELKSFKTAAEKLANSTPEEATTHLIKAGFLNLDGTLSPNYYSDDEIAEDNRRHGRL